MEDAEAGTDADEASLDAGEAGTGSVTDVGSAAGLGGFDDGIKGPAIDMALYSISAPFFIMRKASVTAETACCSAASSHFTARYPVP